ncbi:MAG: hypothetical protein ABI036_05175 [Fibrobacteria bacterium]
MQSQASKKNRSLSIGALCLAGALSALALGACDKSDSTAPTTDPNAMITLTKPVGGDAFHVGDSLRVKWTVKDDPADPILSVDVEISPDSGLSWAFVPWGPSQTKGSVPAGSQFWNNVSWKIPDSLYIPSVDKTFSLKGNKRCLVRVSDYVKPIATRRSTIASAITINP